MVPWRAEDVIVGNAEALTALRRLIIYPLQYSHEAKILGLKWPKGLLLYGPRGTGKATMVRAVVRECNAYLTVISGNSIHRDHVGRGERVIREAFLEAASHASSGGKPSVLFIDDIDKLCHPGGTGKATDTRVTSQLVILMDGIRRPPMSEFRFVVVASTSRIGYVDTALRRSRRLDFEIQVTLPTEEERYEILKLHASKLALDATTDLKTIAKTCNGYVGADLKALCREAYASAAKNCLAESAACADTVGVKAEDWLHAKSVIRASITGDTTTLQIPEVTWDDVGGLVDLKGKLRRAVEWPIKHSDAFSRLGISPVRGILLHGPPGCSKTTLVKAVAHEVKASFFSLSCADVFSKYVGEGEEVLRTTFRRAKLAVPSIIFFDEADAIAAKRGSGSGNKISVGERLLSSLLTEMDGLEEAKGVLVMAATNRLHAIDAALMRPGRFDLVLYVPPPDVEARHGILMVHTRKMKLGHDVDLQWVAEQTELFTGAELKFLCNEAAIAALRENKAADDVCDRHFRTAKDSVRPGLTREDIASYESFLKKPQTFYQTQPQQQ